MSLWQDGFFDVISKRARRHLERIGVDDGGLEFGPKVSTIGIGAHHHSLGLNRETCRGLGRPFGGMVLEGCDGRIGMDAHASCLRCPGKPTRIAQRLDCTSTLIDPAAQVSFCAKQFLCLSTIQESNLGAVFRPLLSPLSGELESILGMCSLNPAFPHMRHIHLVPIDEIKNGLSRLACKIHQPLSTLFAKHLDQIIRIVFQSRDHLPTVSARAAKADFPCFQQHDIDAFFSHVQRCAEAGIATPDHQHITSDVVG